MKESIGQDRFYLFSANQFGNQDCIVEAHGSQTLLNAHFQVPDHMRIVFYAPHGHTVVDAVGRYDNADFYMKRNAVAIMKGKLPEDHHVLGGQQCPDYLLSKVYGNHYVSGRPISYDDVESMLAKYAGRWPMDIVTPRKRWTSDWIPFKEASLKEIVQLLALERPNYQVLHCNFCMGAQLPFLTKGKHNSNVTP